ncbi:eukaryotic membrane protein family-domain-containing protein [Xylariaceae sp. FL0016]|nr:eukaryotic membrane protein family-domain-containing protein [Xylariaceae sp. FL0016]
MPDLFMGQEKTREDGTDGLWPDGESKKPGHPVDEGTIRKSLRGQLDGLAVKPPAPMDTTLSQIDPFPALEVTSATPDTPNFKQQSPVESHSHASESSPVRYRSSTAISESAQTSPITTASKPRSQSAAKKDVIRKLSASQMQALTASPESLPIAVIPPQRKPNGTEYPLSAGAIENGARPSMADQMRDGIRDSIASKIDQELVSGDRDQERFSDGEKALRTNGIRESSRGSLRTAADFKRPPPASRTLSTPPTNRRSSQSLPLTDPRPGRRNSYNPLPRPLPPNMNGPNGVSPVGVKSPLPAPAAMPAPSKDQRTEPPPPSPMIPAIPLPPMSLPTHLQLELAGQRPSPLYINHSHSADMPYESSAVKFERLLNALLLPPYLEKILCFGTLACLDAWLYTFTILPMRFFIALGVLSKWWAYVLWKEARWMLGFVWEGSGRLWRRGRRGRAMSQTPTEGSRAGSETERSQSRARENGHSSHQNGAARRRTASDAISSSSFPEHTRLNGSGVFQPPKHAMPRMGSLRHRRTKSTPSNLTSYNKADLLQGLVLICSSIALMNLDASRMYHFIRGQSSMKLYVIYNILEVADRLLSAIGQDILECLFSSETLSRDSLGRSKLLMPFGIFLLSLFYNVLHTWCLFYQVITLNVAVNSYSNSLLTLLISNQFVEIKGSVFKKIEKENLFQLTCSDVVERFQTWIILLIIGMRNVVEVGGLSVLAVESESDGGASKAGPLHTSSVLPASFTVLPDWLQSAEVLSPFLVVIGIEMLVDWIKHAYINKFNNVKPTIYKRMLDILCKDYYTNAFSAPSLTRRLGLPLLPLSCLFIRASFQVYHMFLATHIHPPIPTSTMELSVESSTPSSAAMVAALEHLDTLIRNALGRTVYGYPYGSPHARPWWAFSSDDAIALLTMVVFFFLAWVVLLIVKLLLGMLLLRYAQRRYAVVKMKEHAVATGKAERENFSQPGQRVGPFGTVELGDDRRKLLYEDDAEGLKRMRERERKTQERFKDPGDDGLAKVVRYEMVAKRIW